MQTKDATQHHSLYSAIGILLLMAGGVIADAAEPPTRKERDDVDANLDQIENALTAKQAALAKAKAMLAQLDESVAALEKTLTPLQHLIADKADSSDTVSVQAKLIQRTLQELKQLQAKTRDSSRTGAIDAQLLQTQLRTVLEDYFRKADPEMVANRFGIDWDGVRFKGTPDYVVAAGNSLPRQHYGVGAEHRWVDSYYINVGGQTQVIELQDVTQHEKLTTNMERTKCESLLKKDIPGFQARVARVGMLAAPFAYKAEYRPVYKNIYGNESEPPSVINNSTGGGRYELDDPKQFREQMDFFTRGKGTTTTTVDGCHVTRGLPTVAKAILCSSAGNSGWSAKQDLDLRSLCAHGLFVGVTATPAKTDADWRDNTKPSELEVYSSPVADFAIARPRWNPDGSPIMQQWLSKNHVAIIEDNLWKLVGEANGTPTPERLAEIKVDHPGMYEALQRDLKAFTGALRRANGFSPDDASGLLGNLRGTSFSSPTSAGVMLAARTKFPDASEEEIMAAALSACLPLRHRQMPERAPTQDDIVYLVDQKAGWRYAPKGTGYGEFVIRDDATEKNPDSWIRMQHILQAMRDERMKMTDNGKSMTTTVVGTGADKHEIVKNGQPTPMTIEMPTLKSTPTEATKNKRDLVDKAVMNAFTAVNAHLPKPIITGSDTISKHVKAHQYQIALKELKKAAGFPDPQPLGEMIKGGILQFLEPAHGVPKAPAKAPAKAAHPSGVPAPLAAAVKKAEEAVAKAEAFRQETYSVTIPAGKDLCCTLAGLRLKFDEVPDDIVILESPDGRKVPVATSVASGTVVLGRTTGFMNQPAVGNATLPETAKGVWKIHTNGKLDLRESSLILSGTERIEGLQQDVREKVLLEMERKEAAERTNLPAKNILTVIDPHEVLHDLGNNASYTGQHLRGKPKKDLPPLPDDSEHRIKVIQGFLDHDSELRKKGFIKDGVLKTINVPVQDKRISMGTNNPLENALVSSAMHLSELLVGMNAISLDASSQQNHLAKRWGDLAVAAAKNAGRLGDDFPGEWDKKTVAKGGGGFHERMNDQGTPFHERKNLRAQMLASREKQGSRDKA